MASERFLYVTYIASTPQKVWDALVKGEAARTLVAEWHETRNGRIVRARSAFDGRPFAAMFTPAGR